MEDRIGGRHLLCVNTKRQTVNSKEFTQVKLHPIASFIPRTNKWWAILMSDMESGIKGFITVLAKRGRYSCLAIEGN